MRRKTFAISKDLEQFCSKPAAIALTSQTKKRKTSIFKSKLSFERLGKKVNKALSKIHIFKTIIFIKHYTLFCFILSNRQVVTCSNRILNYM